MAGRIAPSGNADQFLRQFTEQGGTLVYRRFGHGPAYRVSDAEVADFLDAYVARSRTLRLLLLATTIVLGGGLGLLLDASGYIPSDTQVAAFGIAFVVALVGAFVWLEMRALTRPARVLAAAAPVSAAIGREEFARAQAADVPWINFAIPPLTGLLIVWSLSDLIDPLHGWGVLMLALPIGMTGLALAGARRKLSARRSR